VVDCLANESKVFHERQKNISAEIYLPIERRLVTFGGGIKILEKRLDSIQERLKNEITLVSTKPTQLNIGIEDANATRLSTLLLRDRAIWGFSWQSMPEPTIVR